jgi:hypothetical protein
VTTRRAAIFAVSNASEDYEMIDPSDRLMAMTEDQILSRRLRRQVAAIPEKSRETIIARLQEQDQEPTDDKVLAAWRYWKKITADRPEQEWTA